MAHAIEIDRRKAARSRRRRRRGPWNLVAAAIGVIFLIPFVWLVLTAFERYGGLDLTTGGGLTFSNFTNLFRSTAQSQAVGEGTGQALLNSIYLSAGTMVVTTAVALVAAYPLSRFKIPGKNIIILGIVFVTGLPIIAVVIPTYDIFVTYNLVNSVPWTILFLTATSLPFAVWIGTNFIDSVPIDLEEAAATEGAGIFQTLRYITLPLVTPGAVVIAFYTFIQAWSNFFVPFILLTTPKSPAGVTIYQYFGQYTTNYSGLAAFSLVYAAVPVIFYVDLRSPALTATAAVPSLGG